MRYKLIFHSPHMDFEPRQISCESAYQHYEPSSQNKDATKTPISKRMTPWLPQLLESISSKKLKDYLSSNLKQHDDF
ncbi:hypothetical protein TNCV_397891 [Trichonephila clavipes]|nr:hypothetical protein TNCV_397891 [Trichonephila clavipes]